MPINRQYANVGNLGDIHKHAALVSLARLFQDEPPAVNYLDTHAFLLEAPLANPHWPTEVARAGSFLRFKHYHDLEMGYVEQGCYLCSAALARRVMPGHARFFLSERDEATREVLIQQLMAQGMAATLRRGAEQWRTLSRDEGVPGALLALVDPFRMADMSWQTVWGAVQRLWDPKRLGVVLVFDYARSVSVIWPPGPPGWRRQVVVADEPYHLCCYYAQYRGEEDIAFTFGKC